MLDACRKAAKRLVAGDLAAIAEANGSVMSAVLFGALAVSQALPFARASFEETIRDGGVGVGASLKAFGAACEAARHGFTPPTADAAAVAAPAGSALARMIGEAERDLPPAAHAFLREGLTRLVDYQDKDYARLYLDRLKAIAARDLAAGDGSRRLTVEVARWLALAMSYEDTIRVAELKIRATRFERVRAEVGAGDGEVVAIAEFLHPRLQEIAESVPAWLGRRLMAPGFLRRIVERLTRKGRIVETTSVRGFLLLYAVASLKSRRRQSLRFAAEQAHIEAWLKRLAELAGANYTLALEMAELRNLVKGYGSTHERGLTNYARIFTLTETLAARRDGAALAAEFRKAALADESGAMLAERIAAAGL
jgi:indolepyruvate ferredoxin oxidoreductase beta subunit